MHVLGTAGHVDHGKTTFLRFLTGMEPSRLEEERRRGMTIELGFVWFAGPDGKPVGVVDVPGHEDFRSTMVMGASGIDAFLFIVACDDGWMAQSEEHLWTLKTLGIQRGIAILTKSDLVPPERVEALRGEVELRLLDAIGTEVRAWPFAAPTEGGGPEIRQAIGELVRALPKDLDRGKPCMFLDRVFTVAGQGTVVTGTLRDGCLAEKQRLEVLPLGRKTTIRSIQCYGKSTPKAEPTTRVALLLSDVSKDDVSRGSQLAVPGQFSTTRHLDIRAIPYPRANITRGGSRHVLVIHGGVKTSGRMVYIGAADNDHVLVRVHLETPRWLRFADHILVLTSGGDHILCGGRIVDEQASKGVAKSRQRLIGVRDFSLLEYVAMRLTRTPWLRKADIPRGTGFSADDITTLMETLAGDFFLSGDWLCESPQIETWVRQAENVLQKIHKDAPEAEGAPLSKIAQLMKLPEDIVTVVLRRLKDEGKALQTGPWIRLSSHVVRLGKKTSELAGKLATVCANPEPLAWSLADLGVTTAEDRTLIRRETDAGRIVRLSDNHIMPRPVFDLLKDKVVALLRDKGSCTAAEIRDHLGLGRKLVIMVVERLDGEHVTLLENEKRRLV